MVGWTVVTFAPSFLFSTEVFLSRKRHGSINLGSLADWNAATGGVIAAGSALVIALLGRNELNRRATEGRELSEAVVGIAWRGPKKACEVSGRCACTWWPVAPGR